MMSQEILSHANNAEKVWSEAYNILWPLIKSKRLNCGAEVGVAFGGHAERILSKTNTTLYCIDPFKHMQGYVDPMNLKQEVFDELFKFTTNRLKKFGNRAILLRESSLTASKSIKNKLDFIYLDADHSYEGVKEDLENWFNKINDGGIISGHDYGHESFPGVKKAVDNFFHRFGWTINCHSSGVWWVEKTPIHISYIVPAYNCAGTIEQTIKSIYNNNFSIGDEVIIVNDASTDNTLNTIEKLSKEYKFKIFNNQRNLGGGATRNNAVEKSKNPLIFCLDSDNILSRGIASKLKDVFLSSSNNVVCPSKIIFFDKSKNNIENSTWDFSKKYYDLNDHFISNKIPGSSGNYLFSKYSWKIVGGYREDVHALDTWGFSLHLAAKGFYAYPVEGTYYWHRLSKISYWQSSVAKYNYSHIALSLIIPIMSIVNSGIIDYIFSRAHRDNWFNYFPVRRTRIFEIVAKPTKYLKILIGKIIKNNSKNKMAVNAEFLQEGLLKWREIDGDNTLKLNHKLNNRSIVFDIGGYKGQFSSDIYAKYNCKIIIFEPVDEFFEFTRYRFSMNKNIKVVHAAASSKDRYSEIITDGERSSQLSSSVVLTNNRHQIKLVNLSEYIKSHKISNIALMSINIEGAEYELLQSLFEQKTIKIIKTIQIQFHNFLPNASVLRDNIRSKLTKTHTCTYNYPFVWECWTRKT